MASSNHLFILSLTLCLFSPLPSHPPVHNSSVTRSSTWASIRPLKPCSEQLEVLWRMPQVTRLEDGVLHFHFYFIPTKPKLHELWWIVKFFLKKHHPMFSCTVIPSCLQNLIFFTWNFAPSELIIISISSMLPCFNSLRILHLWEKLPKDLEILREDRALAGPFIAVM